MREILEEEEEEKEESVEERMRKGKKKVRKAEGIILLICLDPVKLQIALNQCFMAVLQISFIYTLYGRTRRNHLSVSYPPPSRVLFLSLGDKELTPVTKIYNSCKKRHVLAFGNNFIPSALSLPIRWKLGRTVTIAGIAALIYHQIRV